MNDFDTALQAVVEATGSTKRGWKVVDGPTTGVGNEIYYEHKTHGLYYVCVDQGEITALEKQN